MKKQNMNKHYQKQNIKKEYAAARNAGSQTAGTATKNTGKKLGEKVSDKLKEFFENNKKVFIWIGVGVALLVLLGAGISSCSMLTSTGSSVIASSYLSEDDAMLGAEAQYCQMEQELQRYLCLLYTSKTKVMFNLTMRQLICFSIAAAVGVPIFFLAKAHLDLSTAAMLMAVSYTHLDVYKRQGLP